MILAPKRRRFRFSLTTLFLLVTAIGCWLGYSVKWIKDRRAYRTHIVFSSTDVTEDAFTAPGLLWLFGERGEKFIVTRLADMDAVRHLFPEATVFKFDSPLYDEPAKVEIEVE